jgi:hypothetical protein
MNRRSARFWTAGLLALVALALFAARRGTGTGAGSSPTPGRSVVCELSNPAYSGWCRVTEKLTGEATPASACKSVLRCLNDTSCARTYCNATTVRGGWKLEGIRSNWKKPS